MNLKEGIKKIYYSEIINLCILGFSFITSLIYLIGGGNDGVEEAGLKVPVMILAIFVIVAAIVAFVLYILGIVKIKDESKLFNYAFISVIVGIAANLFAYIFDNHIVTNIFFTISSVATLFAVYFLLNGLAEKFAKSNNDLTLKAKKLAFLFLILYACGVLITFVSGLLPLDAESVTNILDMIGDTAEIVALCLLILYLKKAIPALDLVTDAKEEPMEEEIIVEEKENNEE